MIRYGVLSTASIVPRYVEGIAGSKQGKALAIASRNLASAAKMAEQLNIPKAYGSYEELLRDDELDVIYIPVMNTLHYEWTKKAIEAHKHVVVEKPFVLNEKEAVELFELAKKEGVFLMEAQKCVFLPTTIKAKELIESGVIGTVKYIETRQGSKGRFEAGHWMNDVHMGGGALYGSIAYSLEFAEYLLDTHSFDAKASFLQGEFNTDSLACFQLKHGDVLINSTIAMDCPLQNEAVIYGTEGKIVIPSYWKADRISWESNEGSFHEEYPVQSEFMYQVDHINDCIEKGLLESPVMDGAKTVEMARVLELLYKSYVPEER